MPQLSSFFVFDKRLGRPLGQCVNWTHVRSRARRKSKWTMDGCGALCRCGCAWTDKGTQFHCVKFRLGSAGEPTICSHCYDVLNEDKFSTGLITITQTLCKLWFSYFSYMYWDQQKPCWCCRLEFPQQSSTHVSEEISKYWQLRNESQWL